MSEKLPSLPTSENKSAVSGLDKENQIDIDKSVNFIKNDLTAKDESEKLNRQQRIKLQE